MNLNMNIQTVLSKYPSNLSDKANEIFTRPADYANSQNDFFEEIFNYVSVYIYLSFFDRFLYRNFVFIYFLFLRMIISFCIKLVFQQRKNWQKNI
jgi:uncharacterized membrane protein SpoIIM required for sporulation